MAIRQIVKIGDSALSAVCKLVDSFDSKLATLIDDMIDTMFEANGVGLAAPQVGILKRIFVLCVDGETIYEFVNPQILSISGSQIDIEGCLSIPNLHGNVDRPDKVSIRAQNRLGEWFELNNCTGLFARAVCHESDHLDGILFDSKIIETVDITNN